KPAPKTVAPKDTSPVLVVVNEQPITSAELTRLLQTRKVPEERRGEFRKRFLEQLIDVHLIHAYLDARQTTAPRDDSERGQGFRLCLHRDGLHREIAAG